MKKMPTPIHAILPGALTIAALNFAAVADFTGFSGQDTLRYYATDGTTETTVADAAWAVLDVYANYDVATDHTVSVFNANFVAQGFSLFNQDDITVDGSWKPSYSFDTGGGNSNIDSFITIGGGVGSQAASNLTTADPNLGIANSADIFNSNVGWYLLPPTSEQGDPIDLQVWMGRFVVTGDEARSGAEFEMSAFITYTEGSSTGAQFGNDEVNFIFTPAPGALAILGLGGVATRRRRN